MRDRINAKILDRELETERVKNATLQNVALISFVLLLTSLKSQTDPS